MKGNAVVTQIVSVFPRKLFFFEFNLMYCDHTGAETIQGRKLFKGGNYLRKYGHRNFEKDLAIGGLSSESFSKQPTQHIVELNSSLRHIIVTKWLKSAKKICSFWMAERWEGESEVKFYL